MTSGPETSLPQASGPVRLGVDPGGSPAGNGIPGERQRRGVRRDIASYHKAFDERDWFAAANWAGVIALRYESFDHPAAIDWWQRDRWLRSRAAAGWDGSCDANGCTERATLVIRGETSSDDPPTFCEPHAREEVRRQEDPW